MNDSFQIYILLSWR